MFPALALLVSFLLTLKHEQLQRLCLQTLWLCFLVWMGEMICVEEYETWDEESVCYWYEVLALLANKFVFDFDLTETLSRLFVSFQGPRHFEHFQMFKIP